MSKHDPDGMSRYAAVVSPKSEFVRAIARTISWASGWDGALPADVFFGVWADFQREEHQIELRACVVALLFAGFFFPPT